ncbi:MAG: hypothetical protein JXX29_21630 [Deltaproteobacteria bacterium]|nr:hypothetical protein [Deltaproteobacteria bacterium]MBN2674297.1 hypothetical protein [Deltaproteobacteria bacterium]
MTLTTHHKPKWVLWTLLLGTAVSPAVAAHGFAGLDVIVNTIIAGIILLYELFVFLLGRAYIRTQKTRWFWTMMVIIFCFVFFCSSSLIGSYRRGGLHTPLVWIMFGLIVANGAWAWFVSRRCREDDTNKNL